MCDSMAGFARLIQDETKGCDILYRLDERLSMPEQDYLTMPVIHLHDFMVHDLTLMAQILILKKQLLFI